MLPMPHLLFYLKISYVPVNSWLESTFLQYRMSSGIMELSNSLIYGNRLCCGSLEIANAKLKFSGKEQVHLKFKEVTLPFCFKFSILSIETSCSWKLEFLYPGLSYCHVFYLS
jgi:hypothetical protein